jgi:hypothetical protein
MLLRTLLETGMKTERWQQISQLYPGAAGKWQVSVGGGTEPRWRGDGKEMFYLDSKGVLTAVPIIPGSTFSVVLRNRSSAYARRRLSQIPMYSVMTS